MAYVYPIIPLYSGSISIALHLVSPVASGLFHRGICQSGAAAHPGSVWTKQQAMKYANKRLSKGMAIAFALLQMFYMGGDWDGG